MQGLQIADFTNKRWKLGTVGFLVVALKLFVGTKPIKAHLQDCTSKADITLIKEAIVHTGHALLNMLNTVPTSNASSWNESKPSG